MTGFNAAGTQPVLAAPDPRAVTKPPPDPRLYVYQATAVAWVDGDTVKAELSLGVRTWYHGPARIAHINAPELHGDTAAAGQAAKAHAEELWPAGERRVVRVNGLDKYGRALIEVAFGADFLGLAKAMVADGFAVGYEGGPR